MLNENLLTTHVLHVDRFGNIILDAPNKPWMEEVRSWPLVAVARPKHRLVKVVRTYADIPGNDVGLLEGSHGLLELALEQDSAAKLLHVVPGATVVLSLTRRPAVHLSSMPE